MQGDSQFEEILLTFSGWTLCVWWWLLLASVASSKLRFSFSRRRRPAVFLPGSKFTFSVFSIPVFSCATKEAVLLTFSSVSSEARFLAKRFDKNTVLGFPSPKSDFFPLWVRSLESRGKSFGLVTECSRTVAEPRREFAGEAEGDVSSRLLDKLSGLDRRLRFLVVKKLVSPFSRLERVLSGGDRC